MKRGLVTRRIAIAILVSFAGLTALALSPFFYGLNLEDAARLGSGLGSGVFASQSDTVLISRPIRLSSAPDLVLKAGTVVAARAPTGTGGTIRLLDPVFEVTVTDAPPQDLALSLQQMLAPLVVTAYEKAEIRRGTVVFKWGSTASLTVTAVDAELAFGDQKALTSQGRFTYCGEAVAFTAAGGPPLMAALAKSQLMAASAERPAAAPWPLRINLSSAFAAAHLDGAVKTEGPWSLSGKTEITAPDAAKLARWLGFGWQHAGPGTALKISGVAHWAKAALTFNTAVVALGDQAGTGAVSVRFREARPLIEASLAFPALDAAPFLTAEPEGVFGNLPTQLGLHPTPPPSQVTWRSLATRFPAAAHIDADWRISVDRLQWRGEPVGSGALSVSAQGGMINADFAELVLGPHRGSMQIMIDGASSQPSVNVRARLQTTEPGQLLAPAFGNNGITGAMKIQYEVRGHGTSMGQVIESGEGRGQVTASGGQIFMDIGALHRLSQTLQSGKATSGWGIAGSQSAFEQLDATVRLHKGSLFVDRAYVVANGLTALMQGRVGMSRADVDMQLQVSPSAAVAVRQQAYKTGRAPVDAIVLVPGAAIGIHGLRALPDLSLTEIAAAP